MTPYDHAERIARHWLFSTRSEEIPILRADIVAAIHACCNDELEKRRAAERQLENIRAGSPVIVCTATRTQLRVWNPIKKCWAETDLIHMPEEKKD